MDKSVKVKATEEETMEGNIGGCINCKELQHGVEPDASGYECENCGENTVYGLEELAIMGQLEIIGDED